MEKKRLLEILAKIYERVPYTVRKDSLDDLFFSRHRDRIAEKVKQKIEEPLPQIPPLITDTFNVFYKPSPKFLDDSQIAHEYLVNKRVLEKVMKTEPFNELKQSTVLDDVNSALATVIFLDTLYQELKRKLKEMKEHTEQIQQLKNQLQDAGRRGNQQQVEQIMQQIQQHSQEMQNLVKQGAISVAARKAQQNFQSVQSAIQSMGFGNQPGERVMVDPETAIQLAAEIQQNEHIRKMIEMLGRMRNLLRSTSRAKPKPSRMELHRITMGRDIERLIPSEILKLRKYRRVFYKDYYEGRLLSYELRRREDEVKGPIVVAMDLSGSMKGAREQWAKAVALATIDQAVREKRAWGMIAFDKTIKYSRIFRKPPSPQEVLEIMKLGASGGTDFENPLRESMKFVEELGDKADILFISDGDCTVSEAFLKQFLQFKKQKGVRVMGVLITGVARVMRRFSDNMLELRGALSNEAAEEVFKWLT